MEIYRAFINMKFYLIPQCILKQIFLFYSYKKKKKKTKELAKNYKYYIFKSLNHYKTANNYKNFTAYIKISE